MANQDSTRAIDHAFLLEHFKLGQTSVRYHKRDVIMLQGAPADAMFYVQSGSVKLTLLSKNGKEVIISVVDGGTFFGESCIPPDRPARVQSAVALTNVQLLRIDAAFIRRFIRAGGDAALSFVSILCARNSEIQVDLASKLVESAEESLARVVASLMQFQSKPGRCVLPNISQQTLAEMVGISRQHVNVLMKRLAKEKNSQQPDLKLREIHKVA